MITSFCRLGTEGSDSEPLLLATDVYLDIEKDEAERRSKPTV